MGNAIAGLFAGLFVSLCIYAYPMPHKAKMVTLWRDSKSAAIADVYGLTAEDVERPSNIFR